MGNLDSASLLSMHTHSVVISPNISEYT